MHPESAPDILDVAVLCGPAAPPSGRPDLVIEVPHGATDTEDYARLAAAMDGPLPRGLERFFFVNTDIGAPELAQAVAEAVVASDPRRSVWVLRCRIPRTFIDTNRRLDGAADDGQTRPLAGRITPGLMPWAVSEADRSLLVARHERYTEAVAAALEAAMPQALLLLLHSYAPRSVDVEVGLDIVEKLQEAYADPERWPLRPQVDAIHRLPDGTSLAPPQIVGRLIAELWDAGIEATDNATYPVHPSTVGHRHATRWPGRVLGVEVRRDLLAKEFIPLEESQIDPEAVARIAAPIVRAVSASLPQR